LKRSFHGVLWSQGREFYNTGIQHLTQYWKKCVGNAETLQKNFLIIAKDVWIIHVNYSYCNYIFWEKTGGITFVPVLVLSAYCKWNRERGQCAFIITLHGKAELHE
jgi:hypothetical protein